MGSHFHFQESRGVPRHQSWSSWCSRVVRERKSRLYLVWRCLVLLLCWHD
ncbi:hypothetical protein AMTRI_Chr09g16480 [Amborella trichopoda]